MGDLLPRPFCGSTDIDPEGCSAFKPELRTSDMTWDEDGMPENIINFPACNNCNATTEVEGGWNTRSDLTTELADSLEAMMHGNELDSTGKWGIRVVPSTEACDKAKAVLKKIGR